MTAAEFRRLALSFPGADEMEHMGHPDFRVGRKIFATLGYPDERFATLMLSALDQERLLLDHPRAFRPAAGAWGRAGGTSVLLRHAPRRAVAAALKTAWARRAPKSATKSPAARKPKRASRPPRNA